MNQAGIEAAALVRLGQIHHEVGVTTDPETIKIIWEAKSEVERAVFRSMVRPIVEAYLRASYDELAAELLPEKS